MKHVILLLSWYDYRIYRGAAGVAREMGWQLICPKGAHQREGLLKNWNGDGCITLLDNPEAMQDLRTRQIPVVDLGLNQLNVPIPRVVTDNDAIGRLAASHFLDRCYREVFVLSPGGTEMFKERLRTFRSHMEARIGTVTVLGGGARPGRSILRQLRRISEERGSDLEHSSFAFFAYEDYLAGDLIAACLEQGVRVPQNVAVLGVDNDDLINSGLMVGLSTVESDQEGLGRAGAELLQQVFENPKMAFTELIIRHPPKRIVARRSTDSYAVRNPMVAQALHWIHRNFRRGIRAIDAARAMKMTQQGLQKAFAQHHIRTPGDEIRHQQAEAAADELLWNSDLNLTKIADQCGYSSVDVFIRNFRKVYGTTPGQYRKKNRREDHRARNAVRQNSESVDGSRQ